MYPHSYYDEHEHPHMHNVGEGRPYLEPDWHANHHGAQLPSLSAIGRGPRGEGLTVQDTTDEQGNTSFAIYSDLTGEMVWQSPNFDPGTLEFQAVPFEDIVPGTPAPLSIVYTRDGVTKTTTAYIPSGDRGAYVYLLTGDVQRTDDDTYTTTIGDLRIYDHGVIPDTRATYDYESAVPRVNDIVFFSYVQDDEYGTKGIAFGTIENVGNSDSEEITDESIVVFTARVFVPCSSAKLDEKAAEIDMIAQHVESLVAPFLWTDQQPASSTGLGIDNIVLEASMNDGETFVAGTDESGFGYTNLRISFTGPAPDTEIFTANGNARISAFGIGFSGPNRQLATRNPDVFFPPIPIGNFDYDDSTRTYSIELLDFPSVWHNVNYHRLWVIAYDNFGNIVNLQYKGSLSTNPGRLECLYPTSVENLARLIAECQSGRADISNYVPAYDGDDLADAVAKQGLLRFPVTISAIDTHIGDSEWNLSIPEQTIHFEIANVGGYNTPDDDGTLLILKQVEGFWGCVSLQSGVPWDEDWVAEFLNTTYLDALPEELRNLIQTVVVPLNFIDNTYQEFRTAELKVFLPDGNEVCDEEHKNNVIPQHDQWSVYKLYNTGNYPISRIIDHPSKFAAADPFIVTRSKSYSLTSNIYYARHNYAAGTAQLNGLNAFMRSFYPCFCVGVVSNGG